MIFSGVLIESLAVGALDWESVAHPHVFVMRVTFLSGKVQSTNNMGMSNIFEIYILGLCEGHCKKNAICFLFKVPNKICFLYIRSNCFICLFLFALFPFYVLCGLCLWNRSRSGLLWCQADRALGHIQNGGSESPCGCSCRHPRSRHLS